VCFALKMILELLILRKKPDGRLRSLVPNGVGDAKGLLTAFRL
jgi:hypothetical protein